MSIVEVDNAISTVTVDNPDLQIDRGNMVRWTRADHRRWGFHNLHHLARYGLSFRAARVMPFEKRMSLQIADTDEVRHLTSLPWFSGMVVVRGQELLYERYAPDFGPEAPHSIQSITKTIMNLVIGRLVEQGMLDLSAAIAHYLPEIGSGYSGATVQQVLNMDVVNDYSEDFADPNASYYRHEEAMGWRLPKDALNEETQHGFLCKIAGGDLSNRSGQIHYKDSNPAVLAWIAERVTGKPLRSFVADIVDAAGLEGALHITSDRTGVPTVEGGACLTARDLARYMSLFVRRGIGVNGQRVGSAAFIEHSLEVGVAMAAPCKGLRYSNCLMVRRRSVGHGGWGGQFALANLDTGRVAVFFSVIENEHAINNDYLAPVIEILDSLTSSEC